MNRCLIIGGGSSIVLVRAIQPSKKHSVINDSKNNNKPEKAQKTIEKHTQNTVYTHTTNASKFDQDIDLQ